MRSTRFDAALADLGERIAAGGGWHCKGDIEIVACRFSATAEERDTLAAWLSSQVPPTVNAQPVPA